MSITPTKKIFDGFGKEEKKASDLVSKKSPVNDILKNKKKNNESSLDLSEKSGFIGKIKFLNTFFNNIYSMKSIKISGFDEKDKHSIKVNNKNVLSGLYGVELVSSNSLSTYLNNEDIEALTRVGGKYNSLVWVLVKNGMAQKNYIFSYNLKLITMISHRFGIKLLKNYEMMNALYDVCMGGDHHINSKDNSFDRNLDLTKDLSYKFIHDGFNKIISNKILENLEDYSLYQAIGYSDLKNTIKETSRLDSEGKRVYEPKKTEIAELFNLDFKGAIFTYINFSAGSARALLNKKIKDNKLLDGNTSAKLRIYLDAIKETSIVPISINTTMLLKKTEDKFSNKNSVYTEIGNCLGCTFEEYTKSSFKRKNIIRYTPLINTHDAFTEVFDKSYIYDYICCVHKGLSPEAQMFGTSHTGAYTNYNLKYITEDIHTTREHFFVGGETGSAKTTFINAMKSQMIKFDWDTYQIGDMNGFKFREYDIKNSLRPFAEFVKKYNKDDVDVLETDLNKFSYNLINCNFDESGI